MNKYSVKEVSSFNQDVKDYTVDRIYDFHQKLIHGELNGEEYITRTSAKAVTGLSLLLWLGIGDAAEQGLKAIDYGKKAGKDLTELGKEAWSCMYRKYKATESKQLSNTTEESLAVPETIPESKPSSPAPGI